MSLNSGLDTAIRNVGDYYAAHYLADKNGFTKDISDKTKAWKEQGANSVVKKLQAMGETYFKAKAQALDYPEPSLRLKTQNKELNAWHQSLLQSLGYQPEPFPLELESEQRQVPALLRLNRFNQPWLVICETPFCLSDGENDEEPLEQEIIPTTKSVEGLPTLQADWEKAVALIFKQEERPRWVMLLAGSRVYLFDAHTYAQGRYLYVDLDDAFGRKAAGTFEAICALLAKDALAPSSETDDVLHERLREGSLKSTHGVSEKLQAAVRTAIEAIANGWVEARREARLGYRSLAESEPALPDGSRDVTPEQLRHDALIYVYRLLFCLYAEARGQELNILPISDPVYKLGYSLEALRDLVERVEPSTTTENGTYFAEHLARLFDIIHKGFHPEAGTQTADSKTKWADFAKLPTQAALFEQSPAASPTSTALNRGATLKTFAIQPLTATLFAPDTTPLLNRVKLSNRVLHQVIRCLSLGTGEKGKRIGRINYAELGILQLGAVYEGLLSYKGFFAKEDLIQVLQKPDKPKDKPQPVVLDNAIDPKVPTWFVPATRAADFKTGEIVLEHRTNQPRIYKTGEFILHLNGVDRVNTASYYTPEVLTRCLISEALKERLKDFGQEQADDILRLTICEPAMGSAAFLVEAIDQLARHYLRLKQQQIGQTIDPRQYEDELRRVRHYIAVHNVYGVDLNPTAVELGALSLWLSTIHRLKIADSENGTPDIYQPGATPWFGLRLRAGNSLVGARRAVWTERQLVTGDFYGKDAAAPRQLRPGEQRNEGEIYHFLVWDEDMSPAARDNLMRQFWPDECDAINQWRNKQIKRNWTPEDIARARQICTRIDALWQDYAMHRLQGLQVTECTASVWPVAANSAAALDPSPNLAFQENVKANLEVQSGAFQRLKLLMDSWCSFYFWRISAFQQLPSREAWLAAAEVLLGCPSVQQESTRAMLDIALGEQIHLEELFQTTQQQLPDTQKLAEAVPWFGQARSIDNEQHFHHWELVFTEVLGPAIAAVQPRGFDLMFGNPPWLRVAWDDAVIFKEMNPLLGVRNFQTDEIKAQGNIGFNNDSNLENYMREFVHVAGIVSFLSGKCLYPLISGAKTNLYKNFIVRAWEQLSPDGVCGFIHDQGVFDEASATQFRKEYYRRLLAHFHFRNEKLLFKDVGNVKKFSLNIFRGEPDEPNFKAIFNLFDPTTVGKCQSSDGPTPGLKLENGQLDLRGHSNRVIQINTNLLRLFSTLIEGQNTAEAGARMPLLHSVELIDVLGRYSDYGRSLDSVVKHYYPTIMFDESKSVRLKILNRSENPTYQVDCDDEFVFSGPHIYISNPLSKSPNTVSDSQRAYFDIDLTSIGNEYFPRTLYRPSNENTSKFESSIPVWEIIGKPITAKYRYANRKRAQPGNERTLIPAILPRGSSHIIGLYSLTFEDERTAVLFAASNSSIVADFIIKISGREDIIGSAVSSLPLIDGPISELVINRGLRLNCLTESYRKLWEEQFSTSITNDTWALKDVRLFNETEKSWSDLNPDWERQTPFRIDFSRRAALVEIDVLIALAIGISIDQIIQVYKSQFAVMKQYEDVDQYDTNGNRLPNTTRKDPGAKELREALKNHDSVSPVTVSWEIDNGNTTVTKTFVPPFKHVDRIEDYRTAYRVFSERLSLNQGQ